MAMDQARKALDTVVGQNYRRLDLSPVITVQDGPERPLLRTLETTEATDLTHTWDEIGLNKPGSGQSTYPEGGKPPTTPKAPVRLSNTVCRIGKVAAVTDTMAAIWTRGGKFSLKDGELERLFQQAIDLETSMRTTDVLNEMEWMLLNGDSVNAEGWTGGQCDGVLKRIQTNVINCATGSTPLDVARDNAAAFENQIRVLAKQIRQLYTPTVPNLVLATAGQKDGINGFVGGGAGRPLVQVVSPDSAGYVAGQEVDEYQTGHFKVRVMAEPQQEIAASAGKAVPPTTAQLPMIDAQHFLVAYLIPLGAEPLARLGTSAERMVTVEFTLEVRNEKSSGKLTGLAV